MVKRDGLHVVALHGVGSLDFFLCVLLSMASCATFFLQHGKLFGVHFFLLAMTGALCTQNPGTNFLFDHLPTFRTWRDTWGLYKGSIVNASEWFHWRPVAYYVCISCLNFLRTLLAKEGS